VRGYNRGMKFSIRDVLWATTLAAIGVAWWVQSRHAADKLAEAEAKLDGLVKLIELDGYYTVEFYKGSVGLSR